MKLKVVLNRRPDGTYFVFVSELPGCVTEGDSRADAVNNIKEAITLYTDDCRATGDYVPVFDSIKYAEDDNCTPWADCAFHPPSPDLRPGLERDGFKLRAEKGSHMLLRRQEPFSRVIIMKRLDRVSIDRFWNDLSSDEQVHIEKELVERLSAFAQFQYARVRELDEFRFRQFRQALIDSYAQKTVRLATKKPGLVVNLKCAVKKSA